ncbi:nuclear transcription factor Y subunit (nfya-1) [Vairimorpha necatrix]|uniref:Transcriptional activator HAP2 n=1 Tax=Vairimorpha necatrix TaxID=6039 RepID=A0AAX4JCF2_9MICR
MKLDSETSDEEINTNTKLNIPSMPHITPNNYNNDIPPMSTYSYEYYNEQGDQPIYVNIKQLGCIQKRKARREYLDTLMAEHKNNYLHESRHRHAMQRKRAPTGRFLTKEESKKLNENEEQYK